MRSATQLDCSAVNSGNAAGASLPKACATEGWRQPRRHTVITSKLNILFKPLLLYAVMAICGTKSAHPHDTYFRVQQDNTAGAHQPEQSPLSNRVPVLLRWKVVLPENRPQPAGEQLPLTDVATCAARRPCGGPGGVHKGSTGDFLLRPQDRKSVV